MTGTIKECLAVIAVHFHSLKYLEFILNLILTQNFPDFNTQYWCNCNSSYCGLKQFSSLQQMSAGDILCCGSVLPPLLLVSEEPYLSPEQRRVKIAILKKC